MSPAPPASPQPSSVASLAVTAAALWAALAGMATYAALLAIRPAWLAVGAIPYFGRVVAVAAVFVAVAFAARGLCRGREERALRWGLRALGPVVAAFVALCVGFA